MFGLELSFPVFEPLRLTFDFETDRIPNQRDAYIIREDKLPFGFGTKWRKANGLAQYLKDQNVNQVLLWGALHGNYLASFTVVLRMYGFKIKCISYSKDPNLTTYNQTLVKRHAHEFLFFKNREMAKEEFLRQKENFVLSSIPEFGIHPAATKGLISFFSELKTSILSFLSQKSKGIKKPILVLEIGSGMSYLVAKEVFQDSFELFGILVSESKEQWIQKVPWLQRELGLAILPLDPNQIMAVNDLFPDDSKHFGKTKQNSKLNILSYFEKTGVLLEPIYSFKSILCLEKLEKENLQEPTILKDRCIFYFHQGGQIQHLDSVWDGKKWLTKEFQFGA